MWGAQGFYKFLRIVENQEVQPRSHILSKNLKKFKLSPLAEFQASHKQEVGGKPELQMARLSTEEVPKTECIYKDWDNFYFLGYRCLRKFCQNVR